MVLDITSKIGIYHRRLVRGLFSFLARLLNFIKRKINRRAVFLAQEKYTRDVKDK